MSMSKALLALLVAATLTSCSSNDFVASWKAPDAQPLEVEGARVAAVVMVNNEASRRVAEDKLAQEITARGAVGVPMYVLYPDAQPSNEPQARAALEKAGVLGIVVMRPVSIDRTIERLAASAAEELHKQGLLR